MAELLEKNKAEADPKAGEDVIKRVAATSYAGILLRFNLEYPTLTLLTAGADTVKKRKLIKLVYLLIFY